MDEFKIADVVREVAEIVLEEQMEYDLCGACGICSSVLYKIYSYFNIKCNLIHGSFKSDTHCWTEVGNNIIDVTATQFGISEPVFVTDIIDNRYSKKECINMVYKNPEKFFKDTGWPEDQCFTEDIFNEFITEIKRKNLIPNLNIEVNSSKKKKRKK